MDIETLSTRANAVVLSMGICIFDLEKTQTFDDIVEGGIEIFFDRDCQIEVGRHVDVSTQQWWARQGEEAQRVLDVKKEDCIHPREFYSVFTSFCENNDVQVAFLQGQARWFARGPTFDMSIMDDMFRDFNVTSPWKYWLVRDIRTWLEALGLPTNLQLKRPDNMVHHNALHDAAYDVWALQQMLHVSHEDLPIEEKYR